MGDIVQDAESSCLDRRTRQPEHRRWLCHVVATVRPQGPPSHLQMHVTKIHRPPATGKYHEQFGWGVCSSFPFSSRNF